MSPSATSQPASPHDDVSVSSLSSLDDAPALTIASNAQSVEWLATSRAKRSTAGNRLKQMLVSEAERVDPEDDLELLFAEDENDGGFEFDGNDEDLNLDSESSSEDEGNGDALEGEHELERADKAARKRRAQAVLPAKFRKKVRIQPPGEDPFAKAPKVVITGTGVTPRDVVNQANEAARAAARSKKKERMSWLPTEGHQPVRASERRTTKKSKEMLHQRMREGEERRKKHVAAMERQAEKREAAKRKPMTQEERIAEALEVEERNSKSLNRWEEAEKTREEERKKKLAALNERTLKGPIITYWSGVREWNDNMNGAHMALEEKPKRKRVSKVEKEKVEESVLEAVAATANVEVVPVNGAPPTPATVPPEPTQPPSNSASILEPSKSPLSSEPKPNPPDAEGDVSMTDAFAQPRPQFETQPSVSISQFPTTPSQPTPSIPTTPTPTILLETPQLQQPSSQPLQPSQQASPTLIHQLPPLATPPPSTVLKKPAGLQLPPGFAPPLDDCNLMPPPPRQLSRPATTSVLAAPVLAPPLGAPNLLEESLTLSMGLSAPKMSASGGFLTTPGTSQGQKGLAMPAGFKTNGDGGPYIMTGFTKPLNVVSPVATPSISTQAVDVSMTDVSNEKTETKRNSVISRPSVAKSVQVLEDSVKGTPRLEEKPDHGVPPPGPNMRTAYILQNFDENVIRDKSIQTQLLFGQKMNRIAKPQAQPLCVITNQPAKYRDPVTGLPYANVWAYKQLKKLTRGEYSFSKLLGAYVGDTTVAAKGVPDRFLKGGPKREVKEEKEKEREKHVEEVSNSAVVPAPALKPGSAVPTAAVADQSPAPQASTQSPTQSPVAPAPVSTPVLQPISTQLASTPATTSLAPLAIPAQQPQHQPQQAARVLAIPPTNNSTPILQPPLVPPHLMKPPAPAALPITNMAPWGVPRPAPKSRARPKTQASAGRAPTTPSPVFRPAGQTGNGPGQVQQKNARTFHVTAPGQTLPARNFQRPATTPVGTGVGVRMNGGPGVGTASAPQSPGATKGMLSNRPAPLAVGQSATTPMQQTQPMGQSQKPQPQPQLARPAQQPVQQSLLQKPAGVTVPSALTVPAGQKQQVQPTLAQPKTQGQVSSQHQQAVQRVLTPGAPMMKPIRTPQTPTQIPASVQSAQVAKPVPQPLAKPVPQAVPQAAPQTKPAVLVVPIAAASSAPAVQKPIAPAQAAPSAANRHTNGTNGNGNSNANPSINANGNIMVTASHITDPEWPKASR